MKKTLLLLLLITVFWSCKNESKSVDYKNETLDVTTSIYPENVSKIFEAHGGIDVWNTFKGMYFEIEKPDGNDTYDVSLKSRKSLIKMKHHELGFDGENVWLKNLDTVTYKSNPKFYYNLMFYFYAMPFVLGDDGIHYKDVPALEYNDVSYPGILISYDTGVGESPEDEYILFYHPETYKMEWLAYTVTFFSKEKSKKFNLIKYDQWASIEGVDLPTVIQWHQYANGVVGDVRNEVNFANAKLSKEKPIEDMFKVPDTTMIIK